MFNSNDSYMYFHIVSFFRMDPGKVNTVCQSGDGSLIDNNDGSAII